MDFKYLSPVAFSSEETTDKVINHIESHIGPIIQVFATPSDNSQTSIRVDVFVIEPPQQDHYLFMTYGMSQKPAQFLKNDIKGHCAEFVELVIAIPKTWFPEGIDNINAESDSSEKLNWVINILGWCARFPYDRNFNIFYGSSIPNVTNCPPPSYGKPSTMNTILFGPSATIPHLLDMMECEANQILLFIGMYFIYPEEVDYIHQNSIQALFEQFKSNNVTELLDFERKSIN